jgi:hypothetical protein
LLLVKPLLFGAGELLDPQAMLKTISVRAERVVSTRRAWAIEARGFMGTPGFCP